MSHGRIAVITHDCVKGGSVGTVAWNQILQFSKEFEVYVFTKNVPDNRPENIHPVVLCPTSWNALRRFAHVPNDLSFQLEARNTLAKISKTHPFDTIWCHSHASLVLAAKPASRHRNTNIVLTVHGDIFDRPRGTYDSSLTRYYKYVTKRAYTIASSIQALSPYMKEVITSRVENRSKVLLIPNGVNVGELGLNKVEHRTFSEPVKPPPLKILFVGKMLKVKGVHHLLKALRLLTQAGERVSLTCIGDGPEREDLIVQTRELGLTEFVFFPGNVTRSKLGTYYLEADVLCVPSDNDPLPTVILEAFATGLPVIGSDTGGITWLLQEGRGLLFKPGDANSLCSQIIKIHKDRSLLPAMSKACSDAAENQYSWNAVGKMLRKLVV